MAAIVDVHCHTFNADDLPVRGFVHRLHLRDRVIGALLSSLIDKVVQDNAPDFEVDAARLRHLLGPDAGLESLAVAAQPAEQFEREVTAAMAELEGSDPELLQRLGEEMAREDRLTGTRDAQPESFRDVVGSARRAVRWAKLFGRSRLDLVAELVRTFSNELDLITPLLVDLGTGLGDRATTTMRQQIELFELLSRATMTGRLPGAGKAHLHPFIGFDPLRELRARRIDAIETPLREVKDAVLEFGFVGIKVYPAMGWRPSGNQPRPGLSADDASELDRIVDDLATWCEQEDVPIAAHGNDSNHADDDFKGFGGPDDWVPVLKRHPQLHLNLGHFGGARRNEPDDGWPWRIARATADAPHLYADVGNHPIHDPRLADDYLDLLGRIFADATAGVMADRLMYGSDWFMLALLPEHERFLDRYRTMFGERFGEERAAGFLGGHALAFLGFDDPSNANAQRLFTRYQRFAPERVPDWLARDQTAEPTPDRAVIASEQERPKAAHALNGLADTDVVLDALPDEVAATVEMRDAYIASLPPSHAGLEFIVADLQRWTSGMRLRVAFLDGPTELHHDVAEATRQITDACNLVLDFGRDEETGQYRRWSESDTELGAEIRVSFDQSGYWSLVGTDSTDRTIGHPSFAVGGNPWQRSLNLGRFATQRPANWQGVVRHEFLHALAFRHAHQNMRGPCQDEFRWDDDEGYVPARDDDGRFVPDPSGRRPGIYSYLAGFPNFWSRAKVDHNLRAADEQTSVAGRFDNASVMLYRFAAFFYRSDPSPCAPTGDGISLSDEDKRGLRLLYPSTQPELEALAAQRRELQTVVATHTADAGPESLPAPQAAYADRIGQVLSESLEHLP